MLLFFLGLLTACPPLVAAQDTSVAARLVSDLAPKVEAATGMKFRRLPAVAIRSRDQLRLFLARKVAEQYPEKQMQALQRTYRAFGIVPDTLDVRRMMVNLLSEQVAGFYDPDSAKLFVIRGADPQMLRAIMAHEMVHALQDQHTRLNDVLKMRSDNDRQMAGQAVFEGQATVGMMRVFQPSLTPDQLGTALDAMRQMGASPTPNMPQLANAPRFVTQELIFPYVEGASFMLSFESTRSSDTAQPFGRALPVSTEQILHPDRYARHDVPARVRLAPAARADTVIQEDDLGEFDTRDALESWGVANELSEAAAEGWNGDRYRVLGTPQGTVLEWAVGWDTPEDAADFARRLRTGWATRAARRADAAARRYRIDELTVNGVQVVRLVDAPNAWSGWTRLPAVSITKTARRLDG